MIYVSSFLCASFCTLLSIPILRYVAYRYKILDNPDSKLKKHKKSTPYLGGVAIYIGFIISCMLFFPYGSHKEYSCFFIAVTMLLVLGLIDDIWVINPLQKLMGIIFSGVLLIKVGYSFRHYTLVQDIILIGWITLVVNSFNLVDILDGLATMLALVSSIGFLFIALNQGLYDISMLIIALIASLLAFLVFNKPSASIFLGDAGSLFIGGVLAAMPLFLFSKGKILCGGFVSVVMLGVPLVEVVALVIIRTLKGLPFYRGSAHHYPLYLRKKGWLDKDILVFSFAFSALLVIVALSFFFGKIGFSLSVTSLVFLLAGWVYSIFV